MSIESELKYGDIFGEIAIKFANGMNLNDFCVRHIASYSPERFDAFAIRAYLGTETIITVYAKDKLHEKPDAGGDGMPVRKFKLNSVPFQELLSICESINFTASADKKLIEEMEVINR